VARIVAFVPDLLFGSRVLEALQAAGHEVSLTGDAAQAGQAAAGAELLVVDLTDEPAERIERIAAVRPPRVPVLAFYAHVEAEVRTRAQRAGFELVVPRSRMAREGAALAAQLLTSTPGLRRPAP
jgi:CheY-like chemotaxis protein